MKIADEAVEAADELMRRGFVEAPVLGDLKVGLRVRHVGQQWPSAYRLGTGDIERIFHKTNSAWAQKYGRPDVELIVKQDDGSYKHIADYHVEISK